MLSLLGFFFFCALLSAALHIQSIDNKARNRFPPTANLALDDVFVAVNLLQDILDDANLNKLDYSQAKSIRGARIKLQAAIAAYAKQPQRFR